NCARAGPGLDGPASMSADLVVAFRLAGAEIGQHGFTRDGLRAEADQYARAGRQVDIDARAETDEPEAFADAEALALLDEGHDAPRDHPGDLHYAEAPERGVDDHAVAFIILAGLVEIGV